VPILSLEGMFRPADLHKSKNRDRFWITARRVRTLSSCKDRDHVVMRRVRTLSGHRGRVSTMAWSSHLLSTGSRDRSILHRDIRTGEDVASRQQAHRSEVCPAPQPYTTTRTLTLDIGSRPETNRSNPELKAKRCA